MPKRPSNTLGHRLLFRELNGNRGIGSVPSLYGSRKLVEDLDIIGELGGHTGCINALQWSRDGSLLASGGDDTHVNLYKANAGYSLNTQIVTGHTQNIFSVKFMPHSSDRTLVTAAGDTTVRIFDIEYAPTTYSSLSEPPPPPEPGVPLVMRSRLGLRPQRSPQPGRIHRTASRVYAAHACRAKRIVTENSPHLFLTCSEDGTVRQFDLRQPSEHYLRSARGARPAPLGVLIGPDLDDDRNPPLISYRRHGIELNTISCSTSQPHYIALGGTHMYCFLHDRRMLGRDRLQEAGQMYSRIPVSAADQESLAGATMCVRRFAPNLHEGWERGGVDSHLTACKISDANPSKVLVSWSADGAYLFDINRSPHPNEPGLGRDPFNPNPPEIPGHRRRNKRGSVAGQQHAQKRRRNRSPSPESNHNPVPGECWMTISHLVVELRGELFGMSSSNLSGAATDPAAERKKSYDAALALAHAALRRINRSIGYLDKRDVDMLESMAALWSPSTHRDDQARRCAMARKRRRIRAFVAAAGCVARALGGFVEGIGIGIGAFGGIDSSNGANSFGYRFLNALVAFLNSGAQGVAEQSELHYLESVELSDDDDDNDDVIGDSNQPPPSKDEKLASYFRELERGAQPSPVLDFETNEELFDSEIAMIGAFRQALETNPSEAAGSAGDLAKEFWGGRVARSVLMREGEDVDPDLVDAAYDIEADSEDEDEDEGWAAGDQGNLDLPDEEGDDDAEGGADDSHDDDEDRYEDVGSGDYHGFSCHLWRRQRRTIQSHAPVFEHTKVYRGHRNVQTVKDVNFFGLNDEYVVSGSDCGHLFIWDRETTELVQLLYGDDETVNVAVGHPHQPTLAVSGIDYTVKLFSPDKQLQSEFADAETSAVPSESTNSVTVSRRSFQDRREIINRNDTLHELGGAGTRGVLAHLINSLRTGYMLQESEALLDDDANCPLM